MQLVPCREQSDTQRRQRRRLEDQMHHRVRDPWYNNQISHQILPSDIYQVKFQYIEREKAQLQHASRTNTQ